MREYIIGCGSNFLVLLIKYTKRIGVNVVFGTMLGVCYFIVDETTL